MNTANVWDDGAVREDPDSMRIWPAVDLRLIWMAQRAGTWKSMNLGEALRVIVSTLGYSL